MTDTFFAISYTPMLLPLLSLLGLGPAWSGVWVDRDAVRVQMGWGFRARIPRESVRTVATHGRDARSRGTALPSLAGEFTAGGAAGW
jgi:hypothetical protein